MKIERFEDIEAWKAARQLANAIYQLASDTALGTDYGLRDQIQRAAVSVMANIAEGFDSLTTAEFIRFLGYSARSASEVQSHLYVALDRAYITRGAFDKLYAQTVTAKSLVFGFIRYLRSSPPEGSSSS
jgi:four helix bundle protein